MTLNLIKNSFKNKTVKLMVADTYFPKFYFSLKSSSFVTGNKYCQLFYLQWEAHSVYFHETAWQISKSKKPQFVYSYSFK